MNREEYIKSKIKEQGFTVKGFAEKIGMPYSTLLSMLNRTVGGAAVDNVIRVCDGLGVTIEELQRYSDEQSVITTVDRFEISSYEKSIVLKYRASKAFKTIIDNVMSLISDSTVRVYRAAESEEGHPDEIIDISPDKLQKLKDAPESDDNLL